MTDTSRHHLPLLAAGQAQKEVTHNEAVVAIDRMLQLAVASRALAVAPAMPADGAIYIVAAAASGAWLGHAGRLASHDGYGWSFTDPVQGCLAWIADETVFTVYDGAWSQGGWPASGLRVAGRQMLSALPIGIAVSTGGSVIDVEARAEIAALTAALRSQGLVL